MTRDVATSLGIVLVLGICAVSVIVGGIWLAGQDKSLDGELIALGGVAVGALAQRLPGQNASQVEVINKPADPIPVEPA